MAKWLFFDVGVSFSKDESTSFQGCPNQTVLGYQYPGSSCAPSLLIGLINMFMMKSREKGYVDPDGTVKSLCYLNYWYPGQVCFYLNHHSTLHGLLIISLQSFFETIFLLIAIGCVPVMLFAKPYFLWKEDKMTREGHQQLVGVI